MRCINNNSVNTRIHKCIHTLHGIGCYTNGSGNCSVNTSNPNQAPVINTANLPPERTVAVVGLGGVGLPGHQLVGGAGALAGHVHVGDWAILGGFTGVHQFVRVGAHSFCGVGTVLLQDLPPFVTVSGNPSAPHGINSEGLKRRGFSSEGIMAIKRAYKTLYRSGLTLDEARRQIAEAAATEPELQQFSDFIADSGRGIVR